MMLAAVFVAIATTLCMAAVLAVFGITHVAMSGSRAIERDGLLPGTAAPAWSLADSSGSPVVSPPASGFQMIMFTDHSLKSFPSVADAARDLPGHADGLEIVILLRKPSRIAGRMLDVLGLGDMPVVTGSASLYGRYNVRVTPFVMFVDSPGRVRSSSLVNYSWQVEKLWRLANVPLEQGTAPDGVRLRRLSSRAEA